MWHGFLGKLAGRNALAAIGVKRVQQAHGETAGARQSRRGRQVAHRADVDGRINLEQAQTFARDVVLNLADIFDHFSHRVVDADGFVEQLAVALTVT